ncbi:MAG TPA: DUF2798 domain-containing protein [Noviherbaspirillum sp.]|nr:DUF2798 domain-containing protein [Noviherbaspirillum sp.]
MSAFAHPTLSSRAAARREPAQGPIGNVVLRLRRSRALASMLPALLFSGLMTLVVTAVMHAMWSASAESFFGQWMESWLTAWPIAFPIAYVTGPALQMLAAAISAPAHVQVREPGLVFGDIADASRRVTRRNGFSVLRGLKPAHDFSAV